MLQFPSLRRIVLAAADGPVTKAQLDQKIFELRTQWQQEQEQVMLSQQQTQSTVTNIVEKLERVTSQVYQQ